MVQRRPHHRIKRRAEYGALPLQRRTALRDRAAGFAFFDIWCDAQSGARDFSIQLRAAA
jgi:hypothetical protein